MIKIRYPKITDRMTHYLIEGGGVDVLVFNFKIGARESWLASGLEGRQLYGGYWNKTYEIVYQLLLAGF